MQKTEKLTFFHHILNVFLFFSTLSTFSFIFLSNVFFTFMAPYCHIITAKQSIWCVFAG